ncbi:hypothetical protein K457DRAFT_486711 [Linnemannia elongata AG-77]|uniref:Uncharacterized protein n=1 Tax=Linnemannia elongata AG-77 TaxID=1314771 RepID=A0A197JWV1_9FUNG|nr:hypothetical protein K457DRAFT_486711 [Linnemannia elongata AG-77]
MRREEKKRRERKAFFFLFFLLWFFYSLVRRLLKGKGGKKRGSGPWAGRQADNSDGVQITPNKNAHRDCASSRISVALHGIEGIAGIKKKRQREYRLNRKKRGGGGKEASVCVCVSRHVAST